MGYLIGLLITLAVVSIPIVAITLSYRQKGQRNKIRELELQEKILQLEIEKQNTTVKLLEEENRKYDRIISEETRRKIE
jgi:predicted kinase